MEKEFNKDNGKKYIPHTDPRWDLELPEGMTNSLVSEDGMNHDDGFNFDEYDNDEDEDPSEAA